MKTTFKTKLLLGAAVTALSFGVATGDAFANAEQLTGNETWASSGTPDDGTTDGTQAAAGDAVDLDGNELTVTNDGTANDGSGLNTFELGAVTDSDIGAGDAGILTIVTGSANDLTVTVASATVGDAISVTNNATHDASVSVTFEGAVETAAGNLVITNNETDTADTVTVVFEDDVTIAGASTFTAGAFAGADTNVSFAGGVTFTGNATLDDGGGDTGKVTLTFNGDAAQAVAGTINGAAAGEGALVVTNTAGVTFAAAIGGTQELASLTLGTDAVATIAAADIVTVTLGTGSTLTQGGALTSTTVNVGSGATLDSNDTIDADNIIIAATGTLDQGAGLITAEVANAGTILFSGAGGITGDITGNGVLTVNEDTTLSGNVAGSSASVAATKTLTFDGANEYSVANTTLVDDGAFEAGGAAQTISGNILADEDGDGAVTITDGAFTTTITGNIGTADKKVGALNVAGGNANVVTTTGNLFVDAIDLGNAANTLQFVGTSSQTVSGTVDNGIVIVGNGTDASNVTFNNLVGDNTSLVSLTVNELSSASFNDDVNTDGAFSVGGTATVGQGTTVTAANFNAGGGATGTINLVIATGVNGTDQSATLASGGAIDYELLDGTTANGARLNLTRGTGVITNAQVFTIADGGGAPVTNLTATPVAVDDTFALYDFTVRTGDNAFLAGSDNTQILAIANVDKTGGGSIQGKANLQAAEGLLSISAADYDAADQNFKNVYDNVTRANSSQINDRLDSIRPDADASGMVAANTVVTQTTNVTNQQLASLRDGTQATGMYAGNISNGLRAWVQGFGMTGDQDRRDGIAGYDVDSLGVAVGMDTQSLADGWIWGLAFAYSDTDVDSDGANRTRTDIDSYQVSLYGNYDLDDRTYISGQVGYIWSDNDQTRHDLGGVSGLNAKGDYDSDTIFARLEAGRKYLAGGNTVLTPKVMVNYQHYDADGYTETGAGGAGLVVGGESLDLFEIGVGVDASWDYQQADGSYLQPKIGIGVRHDLIGDEYETTSRFIGAGGSFKTEGFDPAQTTFNASAGLTYFSTTNWELSAGYNYEVKSDFDSHAGTLKAAYKF